MPDISRSDSNRSDASRPRVSFNRDVHVKRINGPRTANAYSLSSDGSTFVPTSVRRERPRTKKEMTEEAEAVLKQVDKLSCKASSNVKLDEESKPKVKKKRKESFLKTFTWKSDKAKASSSDVDSSSQEYRIYKVNSTPPGTATNGKNGKKGETKTYDFMSLDRKKMKKEKNKNLEYLSLERNDESFDTIIEDKRDRSKKSVMTVEFEKVDQKSQSRSPQNTTETKEIKSKPKLICNLTDEQTPKKKQLTPIIESPGVEEKENNVDKMIKKLSEKNLPKLTKNTGPIGVKSPQGDLCHNDNRPFSYTNGLADKSDVAHRLDGTITESLDVREDLKSTSPTSDVIYAQVLVSGREGNVQKTTVHSRVPSYEVGRVVGESNQSQVGLDCKTESSRNHDFYETVTANSDDMWKTKSDLSIGRESLSPQSELYGENPGRRELYRRKSNEIERKSSSPFQNAYAGEEYVKNVRVASKYDPQERQSRSFGKSPSDLRDLSIRREILLSRSESQAKERFNSLKRLQEPTTAKRRVSSANGGVRSEKPVRNEVRYIGDDTRVNELYATSLRKIPKDVELIRPMRSKRETKSDAHPSDKEQSWKGFGKVHTIVTGNSHAKVTKSKSFIEEKPRSKKIDKMKMLFRKKGKGSESEEDPLSSRYYEYRGSDLELSDRSTDSSPRRSNTNLHYSEEIKKQRIIPNHSSPKNIYDQTGTMTRLKNTKNKESHWLKPLDKLSNKGKQKNKAEDLSSEITPSSKPSGLRFFGDTDQESTSNEQDFSELKYKYGLHRASKVSDSDEEPAIVPTRSESRMTDSTLKGSSSGKRKSKYDLDRPDYGLKQMNYGLKLDSQHDDYINSNMSDTSTLKNLNYDHDLNGIKYRPSTAQSIPSIGTGTKYGTKEKLRNLKSNPVITVTKPEESLSRRVKSHGNLYSQAEAKRGRRRIYDSSAESTTEGDSSQHSSKSMIYLHAATVGDIPGPRNIYKSERRSQSREELSSINDGTVLVPHKKTLSRSFSVLAPWRPKHKDERVLHYETSSGIDNGFHGKPPAGPVKSKRSSSRERKHNELQFNTLGKENRRRKDLIR